MLDIGWLEMLVIGVIVLLVVGPKDLPRVLRTAGKWVRKAQVLARDFQGSLEDMARDSELDEAKKKFDSATRFDVRDRVASAIDPDKDLDADMRMPSWGDVSGDEDDDPTGPPTNKQAPLDVVNKASASDRTNTTTPAAASPPPGATETSSGETAAVPAASQATPKRTREPASATETAKAPSTHAAGSRAATNGATCSAPTKEHDSPNRVRQNRCDEERGRREDTCDGRQG